MHKSNLSGDLVVASHGVLLVFGVARTGVTWTGVILGNTGRCYGDERCRGARTRCILWTFTPHRLERGRRTVIVAGGENTVNAFIEK